MEQNKEMTAQESLQLISETLRDNRKEIVRKSAKYLMLWGCLLTVFSLLVYFCWKTTGKASWNNLWFALPAIGYPLSAWLRKKEKGARAENFISRTNGAIWTSFGIFACSVGLISALLPLIGKSALVNIVALASLTAQIVLLFGMAETISGFVLKNWVIVVAGWLTGIGGAAIYFILGANEEQMFLFTFAGIVLAATGLIVKRQYR